MVNLHVNGARRAAAALVVVASFALAACTESQIPTGTDPFVQPPSRSQTPPPDVTGSAGSCEPGSPMTHTDRGFEVTGVTEKGKPVYALFATGAIQPVTPTTVWWSVTGNGPFRITLVGPGGRIERVADVRPGVLDGWDRPGEPWVARLLFPTGGCWRLYFTRGKIAGDLWVEVA